MQKGFRDFNKLRRDPKWTIERELDSDGRDKAGI
jgi:hypothetical protein